LFESYGRTVWEETCFVFSPDYAPYANTQASRFEEI